MPTQSSWNRHTSVLAWGARCLGEWGEVSSTRALTHAPFSKRGLWTVSIDRIWWHLHCTQSTLRQREGRDWGGGPESGGSPNTTMTPQGRKNKFTIFRVLTPVHLSDPPHHRYSHCWPGNFGNRNLASIGDHTTPTVHTVDLTVRLAFIFFLVATLLTQNMEMNQAALTFSALLPQCGECLHRHEVV